MDLIKEIENELVEANNLPKFGAGDTVIVSYKIKEGNKERVQQFQGVVIQRRGSGSTETFTIRKCQEILGLKELSQLHPLLLMLLQLLKEVLFVELEFSTSEKELVNQLELERKRTLQLLQSNFYCLTKYVSLHFMRAFLLLINFNRSPHNWHMYKIHSFW